MSKKSEQLSQQFPDDLLRTADATSHDLRSPLRAMAIGLMAMGVSQPTTATGLGSL